MYAKAVKPSVPTDREVQIIDYLRTRDGKTILEDLVTSLDQRESKIRRSIRSLEKRDVVSAKTGYTAMWVSLNTPVAASLETRTGHRDHGKAANIATDGGYTQSVSLGTQTVYEMLRNERRRLVIFILAEHGRAYEGFQGWLLCRRQ